MASKTSTPTQTPAKASTSIKTKIKVIDDTGRNTVPRVRVYEVRNKATDAVLGIVTESWTDGQMGGDAYKNSVSEGRRMLQAADAKGKKLGDSFATRARAVAAVRNAS